ncbi:hypothetical protein GCM10028801_35410 [Nocardioides maradonensis]
MKTPALAAAALALPLLVSGCGGTTSADPAPTVTPTVGTSPAGPAHNLPLTAAVIHQLLAVATRTHQQKPRSFSGFEHGSTFYAYDPATKTWWAAGALVAADPNGGAAVSLNDEGAYDVLHRTAGGAWVDRLSGEAGYDPPLAQCKQWPPLRVLRLWHWSQKVCAEPRWG